MLKLDIIKVKEQKYLRNRADLIYEKIIILYPSERMCFRIYTLGQEDKDTAIELLESLNLPATS